MSKLKQKILEERSKHALALNHLSTPASASSLNCVSPSLPESLISSSSSLLFTGLSTHRKAALHQWMDCLFTHSFADHTSFPYSPLLPRPYITHWTDECTDSLVYQLLKLSAAVSRRPMHTKQAKNMVFGFKECTKMIKRNQHEAESMVLIVAIDLEWVVYRDAVVQHLLTEARKTNIPVVFSLSTLALGTLIAANGKKSALVGSVCLHVPSPAACKTELQALLEDVRVCQSEFRMKFLSYLQIDPTLPSPLWICCWYGLEEGDTAETTLLGLLLSHANFRSRHLSVIDGKLGLDPLLICATYGHSTQMKMLVEQKYTCLDQLSSRSFKGQNVISLLCEHGHVNDLQYLLQKRADSDDFQKWMTLSSYHGWSPLRYAISNGQLGILDLLDPYTCISQAVDVENETPFFWLMRSESNMTQYRFIEMLKRLMQCSKENNLCGWLKHENNQGQTLFHLVFSVIKNESAMIKILKITSLECGQSFLLDEIKRQHKSPYEIAKEKQWMSVIDFLDNLH